MSIVYRSMGDSDVEVTGDGRTLRGILVPWDKEIPVPMEGLRSESFRRGAFNDQVREFGRGGAPRIPLGRGHMGLNGELGGTLMGRVTALRDDARGLYGEARVSPTAAGDETLALVNDGVLDQLSIGFSPVTDHWTSESSVVRQKAVAEELAVVMSGAYGDGARIESVRQAQAAAARVLCPECAKASMRDAGPAATALAQQLADLTVQAESDPSITPAVTALAEALAELIEPEADSVETSEDTEAMGNA